MNIGELIEQLQEIQDNHGNIEVRLASQPEWPFEYSISGLVVPDEDEDEDTTVIAYIGEGDQIGYLPDFVKIALIRDDVW